MRNLCDPGQSINFSKFVSSLLKQGKKGGGEDPDLLGCLCIET